MKTRQEAKSLRDELIKFCNDNSLYFEKEEKHKPLLQDISIKVFIKVKGEK